MISCWSHTTEPGNISTLESDTSGTFQMASRGNSQMASDHFISARAHWSPQVTWVRLMKYSAGLFIRLRAVGHGQNERGSLCVWPPGGLAASAACRAHIFAQTLLIAAANREHAQEAEKQKTGERGELRSPADMGRGRGRGWDRGGARL